MLEKAPPSADTIPPTAVPAADSTWELDVAPLPASMPWLAEEVGELAQAVRKGTQAEREHEFADVLAWVASLANQVDVDLTLAVQRYAGGCPRCGASPCACP